MSSNGLWAQLGAAEMIQSCGPEIAEVLTQVDLLGTVKKVVFYKTKFLDFSPFVQLRKNVRNGTLS